MTGSEDNDSAPLHVTASQHTALNPNALRVKYDGYADNSGETDNLSTCMPSRSYSR